MGRSSTFYCKTCRTSYYVGYGSYTTWLDDCRSVAEYDAKAGEWGDRKKNVNVRAFLVEHEGHDFQSHSGDWAHVRDGNLYTETGPYGADELAIAGVGDWTHIDMWEP